MDEDHRAGGADCPFLDVMGVIGGKWRGTIVFCLNFGPRRFNELLRESAPISKKVLTEVLRAMERDGLLNREQFNEIPPKVEYSLTDLGRTLFPIYQLISDWRQQMPIVVSSRENCD